MNTREILTLAAAAAFSGIDEATLVYLIEYGQLNGVKINGRWHTTEADLQFYKAGLDIERAIVQANRAHPGRGWILGNCCVCQKMFPTPTIPHSRWACSTACAAAVGDAEVVPAHELGKLMSAQVEGAESPGWKANPEYTFDFEPIRARVQGEFGSQIVVDSRRAMVAMEQGHGSVYYFPKSDVRLDLLERLDDGSYCQYKGFSTYWALKMGDKRIERFAWTYDAPYGRVHFLQGYIAFYWHLFAAWLEDGQLVSVPRDILGRVASRSSFRALYPDLAKEWHPHKNPNVWPYEVAPFSRVSVWWRDANGREWQEPVRSRVLARPNSDNAGAIEPPPPSA